MAHPRKSSQIARLLDERLAAAHLPDIDLGLSPCQVANAACILSPGSSGRRKSGEQRWGVWPTRCG